jgi:hypothetical protein
MGFKSKPAFTLTITGMLAASRLALDSCYSHLEFIICSH